MNKIIACKMFMIVVIHKRTCRIVYFNVIFACYRCIKQIYDIIVITTQFKVLLNRSISLSIYLI